MLNNRYGAMGNKGFRFFDPRIAEAITLTGQYFIRSVGNAIDAYVSKITGDSKFKATYYQDTDSVFSQCEIYVNGSKMTIGDFYKSVKSDEIVTPSGCKVKMVSDTMSYGVDPNMNLVERNIKYVMKHDVKKRMATVRVNGKEVNITADHSLMVVRDGELIEVKPFDVIKGDKLVMLNPN